MAHIIATHRLLPQISQTLAITFVSFAGTGILPVGRRLLLIFGVRLSERALP